MVAAVVTRYTSRFRFHEGIIGVPIEAGRQLLHYRLIDKIGEGGMGVVWRAIDTSLDREVAVKILPANFASDPERKARFEREAKLLASLNDPHIAAIYGLHEAEGIHFLALELVGGESLDARLARGGKLDHHEVRSIAMQVAAALEAAHGQGVVHRDLKPGNIQITPDGGAKVLDFGLAKAAPAGGSSNPSMGLSVDASPTMTSAGTVAGLILGTAGYMSPEQARGKPVDRRTDLWAFGCVLYEMLTGEVLFAGETVSDSIARVLEREPDLDALPPTVPPSIRDLLRRCLAKDSKKRLRDAGDALLVLEDWRPGASETAAVGSGELPARRRRSWMLPAVAVGGLLVGAAVVVGLRPAPPEPPVRKFQMYVDGLQWGFSGGVFPSPEGRYLAYLQHDRVMIRDLATFDAREANTGGAVTATPVVWSPDSRWFGFQRDQRLWKAPVAGGAPESICPLPETGRILSAAWGRDGRIVFAAWRGGLYTVAASGGTPELLLPVDHATVIDFHSIDLLPDGTVLYDVHAAGGNEETIRGGIHVLEGSTSRQLLPNADFPTYSPTGHLLYMEDEEGHERIRAVPFSASTREITGEPFLVADDGAFPRLTDRGDLAFVREDGARSFQLTWVDRQGEIRGVVGEPNLDLVGPALSPDGSQVAVSFEAEGNQDIWVVGTGDEAPRRLTFVEEPEGTSRMEGEATWSPDGRDVVFSRYAADMVPRVFAVAADGSGTERALFPGADVDFSRDGSHVVFHVHDAKSDDDLFVGDIPAGGRIDQAEIREFLVGDERNRVGRISPAGDLVAYEQREGERSDVYLTRFPHGEGRWQVSTGGGRDPRWSRDGTRLYFLDDERALHEVSVRTARSIELGRPKLLFAEGTNGIDLSRGYDVAADGRLLVVRVARDDRKRYIVFVENWLGEFGSR